MMNKTVTKTLSSIIVLALVGLWQWWTAAPQKQPEKQTAATAKQTAVQPAQNDFERVLQQAFHNRQSNLQIQGEGLVSKTLPDDNQGSRHQRFILKLNSGQTLLVAHNIDLAPKIKGLKKGDKIEFYGEYEWSEQGGVIHWTHKDPQQRHIDGYLKHQNQIYQ